MICKSHYDACRILGIPVSAGKEQWKKAYHEICLKFHPDAWCGAEEAQRKAAENYFLMAREAYEFLENEAPPAVVGGASARVPVRSAQPRVFGSAGSYSDHEAYQKKQSQIRQRREQEKQRQMDALRQKSKELSEAERKKKEKELLDQIRWLRVAQIIEKTIAEDRKKM